MGTHSSSWEKFLEVENPLPLAEYPSVTIIIPTLNDAQKIGITIESLINQSYTNYEILVIDAGSTDRTFEIVKSYRNIKVSIYSVNNCERFEMINKGISMAKGTYIGFIFPGDTYIYQGTLRVVMGLALKHNEPNLVYCGAFLRAKKDIQILYRHLTLGLLKQGRQPTSMQSCWFHIKTFNKLGKFNPHYVLRAGYDFLCRFLNDKEMKFVSTNRVLTDYDLVAITRKTVVGHFYETFKIITKYYGFYTAFSWVTRQSDILRYFKLWWKSVKVEVREMKK